eukprot:14761035-Alexandrium_andersonii.AAC.1
MPAPGPTSKGARALARTGTSAYTHSHSCMRVHPKHMHSRMPTCSQADSSRSCQNTNGSLATCCKAMHKHCSPAPRAFHREEEHTR